MRNVWMKFGYLALVLTIHVFLATPLKADKILGVYFSASNWQPDFSGDINNLGPAIDLKNELNITDDSSVLLSFSLEHPLPFLPNVKVQRTQLNTLSNSVLNSDINFGGITFPIGSQLSSQMDLSHTEYILYYELLDNWASLDLGITLMNFDGNINLQTSDLISTVDLDDYIPAGYARISFELPMTGMFTGAEGSLLSIDDNAISDYKIFVGWENNSGFGAEVGYHSFSVDWEDFNNSNGDLTFDGYYASINFRF